MAHADSHDAAQNAAKVIVGAIQALGVPLVAGHNSWALNVPTVASPQKFPFRLHPFMSDNDDWLVVGSDPVWIHSTDAPVLSIPPEAVGSPIVFLADLSFLPSLINDIAQSNSSESALQGVSALRALHLETSKWAAWSKIDTSGPYGLSVLTVQGWDWRKALADEADVISGWKPNNAHP
jgi:hypothetical protein